MDVKRKKHFFILKEKYEEKSLTFELLLGQDRALAELMLNSGFIDVHLAMANSEIKNDKKNLSKMRNRIKKANLDIGYG